MPGDARSEYAFDLGGGAVVDPAVAVQVSEICVLVVCWPHDAPTQKFTTSSVGGALR